MARHTFIKETKLRDVQGRIGYITSVEKQEFLYVTSDTAATADDEYWKKLAEENQKEFRKSGTEGKCIEARELIIALPENYTEYDPESVLREFTDALKNEYEVECISALHHNKAKTNYHIHLIFSERQLLPEPEVKIATRNMFYGGCGHSFERWRRQGRWQSNMSEKLKHGKKKSRPSKKENSRTGSCLSRRSKVYGNSWRDTKKKQRVNRQGSIIDRILKDNAKT